MDYKKGTKLNQWRLYSEIQKKGIERLTIKRWISLPDGKNKLERLPVEKYKDIRDNKGELEKLVLRLNHQVPEEFRARVQVELKHAFINQKMLDDYLGYLTTQIPTKGKATTEFTYLTRYFLNFFIGKMNLPDPLDWHKIHKISWAQFLLGPDTPSAASTKKDIIAAANRFMNWLHDLRPSEVPPLKFNPLTRSVFKSIEAKRELRGEVHKPQFIKEEHWLQIESRASDNLKPFIWLAYTYGLRRSETLGVQLEDVRNGYFFARRQLESYPNLTPQYAPLKGRRTREVPHWFSNTKTLYSKIQLATKSLTHPDTLTDRWTELMDSLKLDYTFHDLRHTWITKAMRGHNPRDVQLAAGHKNIETTMQYLHDDRELDDQVFKPDKAS